MKKQEMSLKQQYQRLTMAKAQATRNGQPTPKLDKKIEKMKAMMGSTVQKVPAAKPSAGKFVDYKGVNNISYVLTQQDADAIERHCKRLGFKQCCIVATTVNGEKFKENIDVSWIHMRTSLWEEA